MTAPASPWDDLPPYEIARIAALPTLAEQVEALYLHAPKASCGEIVEALGNEHSKAAIKRIRDEVKARYKGQVDEADPMANIPTREIVITNLRREVTLGTNPRAVQQWADALATLEKTGGADRRDEDSSEDWDRLNDLEAGVLIALVHKLNGEELSPADGTWLARLR